MLFLYFLSDSHYSIFFNSHENPPLTQKGSLKAYRRLFYSHLTVGVKAVNIKPGLKRVPDSFRLPVPRHCEVFLLQVAVESPIRLYHLEESELRPLTFDFYDIFEGAGDLSMCLQGRDN